MNGRGYREFVNPDLGELLERLHLDKCFTRGQGSLLYDSEGTTYLDAIAGYGAVPFGHNPEFLWQALREVESNREPAMVQPSLLPGAGDLAEALIRHAPPGLKYVTFANSGTEAVEAAIKACRLATGRLGILSTENAFHGKTLGALSATGRDQYQLGTGAPVTGFSSIPYANADALEDALKRCAAQTAAVIIEPIQGEGGVVEPPAGYLRLVRGLCDRYNVLLILDEIQTGLGRTGELFACEREGVSPDVMTLAKALGGGLLPVSACLLSARAHSSAFARKHSSTFAGNALAMRVGLQVVKRLVEPDLLENVNRRGNQLQRGLRALQQEFPAVIREVRGRGLMLGVQLGCVPDSIRRGQGSLLELLEDLQGLGPIVASYLLNVEHVRCAPTLHGSSVLRVQPPLTVSSAEADQILDAFRRLAQLLASGRSDQIVAHLLRPDEESITGVFGRPQPTVTHQEETEEGRFAFIAHLLDSQSFADFDSSLRCFGALELDALAEGLEHMAQPVAVAGVRVQSAAGRTAVGDFIAIPKTAEQLLRLSPQQALDVVSSAVRLAQRRGARIVGLGGYTSVITQNLRGLLRLGVPLTTGNSYTVLSAIDAAIEAARLTGRRLEQTRATIVGGGGSIGSALAKLLAEHVPDLTLVSRGKDPAQMRSRYAVVLAQMMRQLGRRRQEMEYATGTLANGLSLLASDQELSKRDAVTSLSPAAELEILERVRSLPIRWTTDLAGAVQQSDLVFLVTSSPEVLLTSDMVRPGTVVCDLSRPPNAGADLYARQDVLVMDGGVVEVPGKPDLGWHFGCPPGVAFACMAETMMLALEHRYEHTSLGRDLQEDTLITLRALSNKHGFKLAQLRSRGRPISPAWRRLAVEAHAFDAAS
jgi:acetylornithine/succinyldiaminopimelate/putrescine aminotransferase/predicted amino acid dehydrogenase